MLLVIDMQNDAFYHAAFNAATLAFFPEDVKIFVRPDHLSYLIETIDPAKQAWLKSKTTVVPRRGRLPATVFDVIDALTIAWRHRRFASKTVLLSSGSTSLAALLVFRRFLGDLIVFAHSLDSIVRKSPRASLLITVGAWLGTVFSRNRKKFVLVFQRTVKPNLVLIDLIERAGIPVQSIHVPHPVVHVAPADLQDELHGKRRFVFLGPARPEKRPDLYSEMADAPQAQALRMVHVANKQHQWMHDHIKWIQPKPHLLHSLSKRDIIFCAYDDAHYDMTESGTFLDAIAVRAWALITVTRATQLVKEYPGLFAVVKLDSDHCLVKPRRRIGTAVAKICTDGLDSVLHDRAA